MVTAPDEYAISDNAYQWSVRVFSIVRRLLSVNIKLHHDEDQISTGDIFLFNHFARFETFIPQYLIYQENGVYCRSVAAAEFFAQDAAMASYLRGVGAVPNNHPRLLPFLAAEILRGRKVIVFPEGGMVKDRRVKDHGGGYSIYSRTAAERRKQHRGAAVLALALDAFKTLVRHAEERGDEQWLEAAAGRLGLGGPEPLLAAARKATLIVPANITFYPIRVDDNLLRKGMELFNRGLSRRASEELLIEGNILLKNTDMDIRLGDAQRVALRWHWWEMQLMRRLARRVSNLDEVFELPAHSGGWDTRMLSRRLRRKSMAVRDSYMHEMYLNVTVNTSHLASSVIFQLLEEATTRIAMPAFHQILYACIKRVQKESGVHLHRSLRNPAAYSAILDGGGEGLRQFLANAGNAGLVGVDEGEYVFSDKLAREHSFDEVRLENIVEVYANEVAPITVIGDHVADAIRGADALTAQALAALRFDDQLLAHRWDLAQFSKPRHAEINAQQTATADPSWFLELPKDHHDLGVVLVHGFLASPAEVRGFGERLAALGYPVIGVRLKGHGTSPWDLRERSWQDWLASVQRGCAIMRAYAARFAVVGFSTGGSLALRLAADRPPGLAAVCAVAVPLKFEDRNMRFVPLVHGANRLVSWVSSYEGVMPFRENNSEHPDINYRHMPIRGLYELRLLVSELERRLPDVRCPLRIVQGDRDPVVVPHSARMVHDAVGSTHKDVVMVHADRHGILSEDIDGTQQHVIDFLDSVRLSPPTE